MSEYIQIFALVTGIAYMVAQIFQHKWMWPLDLLTCSAACYVALTNTADGQWAPLWAQVAMNVYFFVMAVIGIFTWKDYKQETGEKLHIVKLTKKETGVAGVIVMVGAPLMCLFLYHTNDPSPVADGMSMMISVVAAWFLTKSHLEQWIMWIAADNLAIVVYAEQGAWWMVLLYYCYIASSIIGIINWRRNGIFISRK